MCSSSSKFFAESCKSVVASGSEGVDFFLCDRREESVPAAVTGSGDNWTSFTSKDFRDFRVLGVFSASSPLDVSELGVLTLGTTGVSWDFVWNLPETSSVVKLSDSRDERMSITVLTIASSVDTEDFVPSSSRDLSATTVFCSADDCSFAGVSSSPRLSRSDALSLKTTCSVSAKSESFEVNCKEVRVCLLTEGLLVRCEIFLGVDLRLLRLLPTSIASSSSAILEDASTWRDVMLPCGTSGSCDFCVDFRVCRLLVSIPDFPFPSISGEVSILGLSETTFFPSSWLMTTGVSMEMFSYSTFLLPSLTLSVNTEPSVSAASLRVFLVGGWGTTPSISVLSCFRFLPRPTFPCRGPAGAVSVSEEETKLSFSPSWESLPVSGAALPWLNISDDSALSMSRTSIPPLDSLSWTSWMSRFSAIVLGAPLIRDLLALPVTAGISSSVTVESVSSVEVAGSGLMDLRDCRVRLLRAGCIPSDPSSFSEITERTPSVETVTLGSFIVSGKTLSASWLLISLVELCSFSLLSNNWPLSWSSCCPTITDSTLSLKISCDATTDCSEVRVSTSSWPNKFLSSDAVMMTLDSKSITKERRERTRDVKRRTRHQHAEMNKYH